MDSQSLTKGWRGDVNTLALGYFRTDDTTTSRILSLLTPAEAEADALFPIYDPCCGEGVALSAVQKHLPQSQSYGIELDVPRFQEASKTLDMVLHGDATEDFYGSSGWASLCWFNPPYADISTDDGNARLEFYFWRAHADRLQRGGIMVAILPTQLFQRFPQMAKMFGHYFGPTTRIYQAATDKFNQIIVIGPRATPYTPYDNLLAQTLLAVCDGAADVPVVPHASEPLFTVPTGKPPQTFQMVSLTEAAMDQMFQSNQAEETQFLAQIGRALVRQDDKQRQRSVMPLRDGHVPAVLASGLLDGLVTDASGSFLVKGSVRRTAHKKQKTAQAMNGNVSRTTTVVHTSETSCFAWNLATSQLMEIK